MTRADLLKRATFDRGTGSIIDKLASEVELADHQIVILKRDFKERGEIIAALEESHTETSAALITEKQKNEDLTTRNVELRLKVMRANKLLSDPARRLDEFCKSGKTTKI